MLFRSSTNGPSINVGSVSATQIADCASIRNGDLDMVSRNMLIKDDKVAIGGSAQDEMACPKRKTEERSDRAFLKKYKLGNHDRCLGSRVDVLMTRLTF